MNSIKQIAVIGAGWAGCAAATELTNAGHRVTLIESSRTLGGRARAVTINDQHLDNGQHILLGAYTETLRLLKVVGVDADQAMLRLPLQMRYAPNSGGMDFRATRLPAPLHVLSALLRAKGLTFADKLALARFSTTARWMDWRLHNDCSVTELLDRFDQTPRLIQLMWRPLCIAALNTPPERASAQIFLNVLRDSLGGKRAASDMLIPHVDLTSLFPLKAAEHVARASGNVLLGTLAQKISHSHSGWSITPSEMNAEVSQQFDGIVIATSAAQAASLLSECNVEPPLPTFEYEPITTCYLQYPAHVKLDAPFFALIDNAETAEWGQFVFDRGQLDPAQAGLLAVVVSASSDAIESGHEALSAAIAAQLANVFDNQDLARPDWSKVISDKRATFSCAPGLTRPSEDVGLQTLVIAGDYVASDYPATLESAVRSGVKAARLLNEKLLSSTTTE
jgi:squalene-associated FAD-dependent desaturase